MCRTAIQVSRPLALITMRREIAAQYARLTRRWLAARSAYRRLHQLPVTDITAVRNAALRMDALERGRAALLSDLKALSV